MSRSRWHEAGTRSRGLWRNSHGSVVCARPTVGVDLRWGCPLPGCVLTAVPHVSGKTLQWRPSTPTKPHTTPSCAGQVSAAAPFHGRGLGRLCNNPPTVPGHTPPAPIYFQVGCPLEIKPEFAYHSKAVGCTLVSVSLLASSLPVLLKVAHLLLWKVHR